MNEYTSAVGNHPMYVSYDGEYGSALHLHTFQYDDLTADQWELVGNLDGTNRWIYIGAILGGDHETAYKLEGLA